MKINKILFLLPVLFSAVSCGGGNTTPSKRTASIIKPVEHATFIMARDYLFNDTTDYIVKYPTYESEDKTKICCDLDANSKLSLLVEMDEDYIIKDGSFLTVNNEQYSSTKFTSKLGTVYFAYDITEVPKASFEMTLNYQVEIEKKIVNYTIGTFTAPTTDPYSNYDDLLFRAWIGNERVSYLSSDVISAANLEAALKAKSVNNIISIDSKEKIVLEGYYGNRERVFMSYLGNKKNKDMTIKTNYVDFYTRFTINVYQKTDASITFDFSSLETTNFKDYVISSRFGDLTPACTIFVDGNTVSSLNHKIIDEADTVLLRYAKSELPNKEISGVKINDEGYYEEGRVITSQDYVAICIKGSGLKTIYSYSDYSSATVENFNIPKADNPTEFNVKAVIY